MGKQKTLTDVEELFGSLDWRKPSPESPTLGEVLRYRDGSWAFVGTSSHVSYGPREEVEAVARPFTRHAGPVAAAEEGASQDE